MSAVSRKPTTDPTRRPAQVWAREIPPRRRGHLRIWLWTGAALTFIILIVGGITRLTQSGLSIVDWRPIMGVIPPLSAADWQEAFDQYRQYPEYQQLRRGMTMSEFQFIFFWEYLHRMVARLIGLVFIIPFAVFAIRGYFNRPLLKRVLLLFGLGALQGFMGWFMVMSGLVDQPNVSHYRLATHLSIAFLIFGLCLWIAADLQDRRRLIPPYAGSTMVRRGLYAVGALLGLQIVWGAFVAGMKAGLIYNTFPLMGTSLVPSSVFTLSPVILNFFENPVAVQWVHRTVGTVLALASIGLLAVMWRRRVPAASIRWAGFFATLLIVQYVIGVMTLLYYVPISLGVIHQATAMLLFGTWLLWVHHERQALRPTAAAAASGDAPRIAAREPVAAGA
jgi:heme a synthase